MGQFYEATARGAPPVKLEDAKVHLKLEHTDADDDLLTLILKVATEFAEGYTAQEIRVNTWKLLVDEFEDRILLRRNPVDAITSVKHLVDTVLTLVASSTYYLKKGVQSSEILLASGEAWPTDTDDRDQAVEIIFTTVAIAKLDVVRLGILRHVAHLYENRGDCDSAESARKSGATLLYDQVRISRV